MNTDIPGLSVVELPDTVATPDPGRTLPATRRILKAEGVDLISFTFSPGQVLGEHHTAHPVTIQCLDGEIDLVLADTTVRLRQGTLLHLEAGITHHVQATPEATEPATILVSLLTGHREVK
ncbi:cupin domain protein [Corynebacterium efficiens YS-314]|nr:cupin domain-containing protein [Corynebacterium efficiens]EEW49396.1 cupin domain protein [Corynebacterium efficiens YS-314]